MKKNVWIMNHYATNTFFEKGGRHYWVGENLIKEGYNPIIFCASTLHGKEDGIKVEGDFSSKIVGTKYGPLTYVFIKAPFYKGNGKNRIKNMISFALRMKRRAKNLAIEFGEPDIVYASSVHPLTLVAGIKIAKQFKVKCISEVRDLWPESIVAYSSYTKSNPLIKLLYLGEKWIYKHSDALVFTMEGGKDYIKDQGWDLESGGPVNLSKVHHINNGIDLELFDENASRYILEDEDLNDNETFKVIYSGSIRSANNVSEILEVAKLTNNQNIKFLIWGDGDQLEILKKRIIEEKISNVVFKGRVEKKYIPYITTKASLNYSHASNTSLFKYGISFNKIFEYLAAGKPIFCDFEANYNPVLVGKAGISVESGKVEDIAKQLDLLSNISNEELDFFGENARFKASEYDFSNLTDKVIKIIESL